MRKYLPTFAELVDRLSIVILKSIFIAENSKAYRAEVLLILADLDEILKEKKLRSAAFNAGTVYSILVIMLANHYIWENESKARHGGSDQDKLLKLTHSINGVRNTAKNVMARSMGERVDLKVDALAAELVKEFGNWNLF